jgi:hypothetical protein
MMVCLLHSTKHMIHYMSTCARYCRKQTKIPDLSETTFEWNEKSIVCQLMIKAMEGNR